MSEPGDRAAGVEGDGIDRRLDESLSAIAAAPIEPPAMSDALVRELGELDPVGMRFPRRESAVVFVLSLVYATGLLAWLGVRDDWRQLPRAWLVVVGGLWLGSFVAITWLVLVPPREQVMPRWRWAAALSVLSAALLIAIGLLRPAGVAATGVSYPLSLSSWLEHGHHCLRWGLAVALLPVILSALAVRGAVPVGSRWAAAAIGAAGGSLGGLVLHLHCPVSERFHVGLVHGGLVVVAALLAALVARIVDRPRPGSSSSGASAAPEQA